jgi:hypothetical protein
VPVTRQARERHRAYVTETEDADALEDDGAAVLVSERSGSIFVRAKSFKNWGA